MKKLLFLVLCTFLPSCSFIKNLATKDQIVRTGVAIGQGELKKLFPSLDFSKDRVYAKDTFQMQDIRELAKNGKEFREFLTEEGELSLKKLDFEGKTSWSRISEEQVVIEVLGIKKQYTPRYGQGQIKKTD